MGSARAHSEDRVEDASRTAATVSAQLVVRSIRSRHPAMRVRGVAMNVAGMVRGDDALIARGIVTQRHATDMAD